MVSRCSLEMGTCRTLDSRASWPGTRQKTLCFFLTASSRIKEHLTGSVDGRVDFYLSGGEEKSWLMEGKGEVFIWACGNPTLLEVGGGGGGDE